MAKAFFGLGVTTGTYADRLALTSPTLGALFYQTDTDEYVKYATDLDGTARWMQADHDYGRSLIINGGLDIWQRGFSFNMNTTPYYSADRWQIVRASAVAGGTASRQASGLDGFTYCARVQRDNGNAATNGMWMATSFETVNVKRVQTKYLTFSFWARAGSNYSSASNALTVEIIGGTGTDGSIGFGFTSSTTVATNTATLTTSWKRFTLTTSAVLPNTTTQLGVRLSYTPVGTASTNDYFEATGLQLEAGTAPSDFEYREFGDELRRCQRYYFRNTTDANYSSIAVGASYSTSAAICPVILPVKLRVAPTGNPEFASLRAWNPISGNAPAVTGVSYDWASSTVCAVAISSAGTPFTSGTTVLLQGNNTTGAYLGISAEL
jgi:hypothetical protein